MIKKFFAVLIFLMIIGAVSVGEILAQRTPEVCDPCDCSPTGNCCGAALKCIGDTSPGDGKATGVCQKPGEFTLCPATQYRDIEELIDGVLGWLFKVALIVAPVMIIIGAILFMTAGGNPDKIKTGKKIIFWTVIGFLVILFSEGIKNLIEYILGRR